MTELQRPGWKMGRLFQGLSSQTDAEGAVSAKADAAVVRLIDSPRRAPATPIEQRLISTLRETGSVSFARLVNAVSADLYAEELRTGAGALDIGLFGSRLFNGDVIRELKAGDGILWKIGELK
jgi:hypothetical protein